VTAVKRRTRVHRFIASNRRLTLRCAIPWIAAGLLAGVALPAAAVDEPEQEDAGMSEECRRFRADPDADLGEVLRAGCEPTLGQMSALMDNPLGNVAMFINQYDGFYLTNDEVDRTGEWQHNYMGILQFPKSVHEDWNLINRIVYNIPSAPLDQDKIDQLSGFPPSVPPGGGPVQPPPNVGGLPIDYLGGRTSGFGDLFYVGLLSPKKGIEHGPGKTSVWGFGLDLAFPTATDDVLGDGKYSMGPSALYAYMGPEWKIGGLVQTYFSYAGDDDREDVRMMNIQYFVYYSVSDVMSIGAGPNIIGNFEADTHDKWTFPVGIGINRTFQIGKMPVRIGVEYHYSIVRPETVGSQHDLRLYVIPAAPSALFKWMQ
jgi:hypothetical protein